MVPLAAPGLYFVSVRENPSAETPFQTVRVYLKRLPSGAYRVTVLSPSLPRPVFRSYPAGTSEADAVARAVGRALEAVKNHINYSACCHSKNDSEEQSLSDFVSDGANMRFCCEQYAPNKHSEHGIGGGQEHQAKIAGVDHLPSPFPRSEQQPDDSQPYAHHAEKQPVERIAHSSHEVTQHRRPPLRLRVLWQGLLG